MEKVCCETCRYYGKDTENDKMICLDDDGEYFLWKKKATDKCLDYEEKVN